uniref:Uncharacterized protein n=1 Tax=Anguilla anguilla TaxID=7936 RepID=A0A0E9WQH3_ANGAN
MLHFKFHSMARNSQEQCTYNTTRSSSFWCYISCHHLPLNSLCY